MEKFEIWMAECDKCGDRFPLTEKSITDKKGLKRIAKMNDFNLTIIEGDIESISNKGNEQYTELIINSSKTATYKFCVRVAGKLAENCNRFLEYGSRVLITGFLTGTEKDCYISCREVKFLPSKKDQEHSQS